VELFRIYDQCDATKNMNQCFSERELYELCRTGDKQALRDRMALFEARRRGEILPEIEEGGGAVYVTFGEVPEDFYPRVPTLEELDGNRLYIGTHKQQSGTLTSVTVEPPANEMRPDIALLRAGFSGILPNDLMKKMADLPGFLMVVGIIAASHALADRQDEARRAMNRLRELNPTLRVSNLAGWLPFHRPEDLALFANGLRRAGLPQ